MKNIRISKKSVAFLLGLLSLSCLFIFKDFLFGNKVLAYCAPDIGSDTYDQYLFHYQSIINHISEGNFSLWDFNNGYGVNVFTYNLFNPFLLLIYLFGVLFGAEQIYGILVYIIIIHILLAGVALYLFLSCFDLCERSKVVASYIYALCGYMVVWGQHYQFGSVIVFVPLLFWAVEGSFRTRKLYIGITVLCAVVSLSSLYMAYMQFLVLGFYVLFRVAWKGKLFSLNGMKQVGKIYGSMILGIGIGLIQLLPSAYLILNVSGRVGGGSFVQRVLSMLIPYSDQYYEVLFTRFLSSNLLGVNDYIGEANYYEDPQVFLSALLLIALVQFIYFFFTEKYSIKQRILLVMVCALLGFMLLIPLGSAIFNAFAYAFSRHTYLMMPFGAWVIAYVLHKIFEEKTCNKLLLIISSLGIFGCYILIFLRLEKMTALLLGGLTLGICVSILGYVCLKQHRMRQLCVWALLGCVVLTMSGDAYLSYSKYRVTLEKDGSEYMENLYDEDVFQAIEYIESIDNSFYRIEKDYTAGSEVSCMNAMAQKYRGISTYNSTVNTNIYGWLLNVWPRTTVVNMAHFSFANAANEDFPASISNVRYVLSKNPNYSAPGYVFLKQFGDVYVFKNTHTKDIAKFYTKTVTTEDYNQIAVTGNQYELLANYLLCNTLPEYQVPVAELELTGRVPAAGSEEISVSVTDGSVLNIYTGDIMRSGNKTYMIEFDIAYAGGSNYVSIVSGGTKSYTYVDPNFVHLSFTLPAKGDLLQIHPSGSMDVSEIQVNNIVVYECEKNDLTGLSEGISFENPTNDGYIKGTANVKEPGILMIAIPHEQGWHAYVDGKEVEIHNANLGFCGIVLNEGEHEVEMRFKCPGFALGLTGSVFFLVLTVVIWSVLIIKANRENNIIDFFGILNKKESCLKD